MRIELNNYRVLSNHGTSDEWNNKPGFIPLEGEIILYTDLRKFKVGDGQTVVGALDFYTGDTACEIRFSASADGANMTTTWSEGQAYIGFLNDATAPNDPASYIWCQFITSYTPSGWTVDQISKLEQIFNSLVYTDTSTQAVADALIASLRSGGDTPVITWTLTALEVLPTSITVPAGTPADNIKTYLTSMTGTYQSSDGQTETRDLTAKISEVTISGTMPSAGSTATMTIAYGGKNAAVSVTMEAVVPTITGLTVTYIGGAVAAGTTLDQLNEVVKATYSDGTTSAALTKGTDYTLSGTLTAGQTNTVMVTGTGTYAGHTTTFSVTVNAVVVENNYWVSESVTGSPSKDITFPISGFDASDFEKIRYIDITGAKNNTAALSTEIASLRLVKENGSWTLHEARQANQTSAVDETLKSVSLSGSGLAVSITTHAFNAARDYRLTCYDDVSSLPVANINESYDRGLANATGGNSSTFTIMARRNGGLIKQSTDLTSITIIEDATTFSPTNNAALKINSNKLSINKDSQGTWTGTVEYRKVASDSPTTVAVTPTVSVTTDEVFGNSIISITAKTTSNAVINFFYSNKNIGTIEIS